MNICKVGRLSLGAGIVSMVALQSSSLVAAQSGLSSGQAYYYTLNTKQCNMGAPGYSWPFNYNGKTVIVVGDGPLFLEYPIPKTRGITGKYARFAYRSAAQGYYWVGDFRGTGRPIMASGHGNKIMVRGHYPVWGGGYHQVSGTWGLPGYTWANDFDGDGVTDIATASGNKVTVHVSELDRSSGFVSQVWNVAGYWGDAAYTFSGDFDGNGKADIASAYGSTVYMSLSSGKAFSNAQWTASVAWGAPGYSWAGDFNGDGRTDILSASGARTSVAFSNGSGFSVVNGSISNVWGDAAYTWAHDFNNDGKTDIATARGCEITVKISDGKGNFNDQPKFQLELPATKPRCIWILDGSGASDALNTKLADVSKPTYDRLVSPGRGDSNIEGLNESLGGGTLCD